MRLAAKGMAALALGLTALAAPAWLIGGRSHCEGETCGASGTRSYVYRLESPGFPMTQFSVGTRDLDRLSYGNVLAPPGWSFAVEDVGLACAVGAFTAHESVSPGPGVDPTYGRARWWTTDPANAVESFTFGFDHRWEPGDVGWELKTRREGTPPQIYWFTESWDAPVGSGSGPLHGPCTPRADHLDLAAQDLVRTSDGQPIDVSGYSVPSFALWDGDDLPDLIVGEGGGSGDGKVRVYPNIGSACSPAFQDWFYAQAAGADLAVPASGCMGCFPRVVYWDDDARKDLVVGQANGMVTVFLNVNTDEVPEFDAGTPLQVGAPWAKVDIDVGNRACSTIADWNRDGRKDLVVGAYDGFIHVFLNEGTHFAPDFRAEVRVQKQSGGDLAIPGARSSPVVRDLTGDGIDDILAGNTGGELLLFSGPDFDTYVQVEGGGVPIDLPGSARSRPFVCAWRDDMAPDVLIGAGDGLVYLYEGVLCELALEVDPRSAGSGETVEFRVHHGLPDGFVLLVLVDLDGVPYLQVLDAGTFGDDHEWSWSTQVPPGLSGMAATFQAAGISMCSSLAITNEVMVIFE